VRRFANDWTGILLGIRTRVRAWYGGLGRGPHTMHAPRFSFCKRESGEERATASIRFLKLKVENGALSTFQGHVVIENLAPEASECGSVSTFLFTAAPRRCASRNDI